MRGRRGIGLETALDWTCLVAALLTSMVQRAL